MSPLVSQCVGHHATRSPDVFVPRSIVWTLQRGHYVFTLSIPLSVLMSVPCQHRLAVWLSGNALASINVVALRQTRLVPRWVTVGWRLNRLGM